MKARGVRLGVLLIATVSLCPLSACGSAQTTAPSASPTAAADRAAILAALQTAVEDAVGQPVSLAATQVEVGGDYALVSVAVKRADGGEIDWAAIPRFATAYEAGGLDPRSEALLQKKAGTWEVVEVRIGPTDSKRDVWIEEYAIPPLASVEE